MLLLKIAFTEWVVISIVILCIAAAIIEGYNKPMEKKRRAAYFSLAAIFITVFIYYMNQN